ncbi:hypothetical protein OTU49_002396, partial [Cherax quadricarinatus]
IMGCTPSLHVSHTGVIYCGENDSSPSHSHSAANHQPPTTQPTPLTHNQHQGPAELNQHGYGRAVCPLAWTPSQTECGFLRVGPMKVLKKKLKVLLVFGREDSVSEAWWSACKRQEYDVAIRRTSQDALKAFLEHTHDLVIIDARSSKYLNADNICSSIRVTVHSQFSVLVGVVKKNFADRENPTVGPMLKNGYNRIVTEVSTVGGVLNDLIQIEHSDLTNQCQLRAMQAVFSALDACKEVVHITDTEHRIQGLRTHRDCHLP